jgi:DNA repair photolyase
MDHQAFLEQAEQEQQAYKYFMRTDPDMRDMLGPIERVDDPLTGRGLRRRAAKVGALRGTKPENMHETTVYLDPVPHIRIDKGKDLQGWYQSKELESRGSRVRPCMTDAVLTQPYGGWCPVGCGFCLPPGELVDTPRGPRPIEQLRRGDFVWGRDRMGVVLAQVTGAMRRHKPEGYLVVFLAGGTQIRLTADHPVYSRERGWVEAGWLRKGEQVEVRPGGDGPQGQDRSRALEEVGATVAHSGRTQECGDPQAHERGGPGSQVRHVASGQWAQEPQMEAGAGGACAPGHQWLSALQEGGVHGPIGADAPHEVGVGVAVGSLAGQEGLPLGLRARSTESPGRVRLPAGLPAGGWPVPGGQGLHGRDLDAEGSSGEGGRPQGPAPEQAGPGAAWGAAVEAITQVEGGLDVFDIQTTTQNFYQRGVLVHNCYINSGIYAYRGSGLVTVPVNYGAHVRKQLASMRTANAGYFSSFTDPFLPLEDYYHNTQAGAQAFLDEGLPIFFLSRLSYPSWAIDMLRQNPLSYAQKSINTPDPDDWKKLSPGALALGDHFDEIRELRRAGIYVSIQCNPIVAGIVTHEDVEHLFELLAEAGTNHVIVKFVEANLPWAGAMVNNMVKRFGDNRAAAFRDLFTENSAGAQRTVDARYRLEGHERYQRRATQLGMTYATCYEYVKTDKGHASIGPIYTTADQCHGHRVPMHTRRTTAERFAPLEDCPPSGCLHCADNNDGKPRCGSDLLGAAKALRLPDLRKDAFA